MIHSSHSGRSRLSGVDRTEPASSPRAAGPAGLTWRVISKRSSSTQTGRATPKGTPARRWR